MYIWSRQRWRCLSISRYVCFCVADKKKKGQTISSDVISDQICLQLRGLADTCDWYLHPVEEGDIHLLQDRKRSQVKSIISWKQLRQKPHGTHTAAPQSMVLVNYPRGSLIFTAMRFLLDHLCKNLGVTLWAFSKRNICLALLSPIRHCFCHTRHHFHRREHRSICLLCSPLSGIKVRLIGVIIPLYADSLSLNPLRSTLCHAWLTCLCWCQVLAVSRRLPYATVLLSPLMSVKWMSARAEDSVRRGACPETHWQWHAFSHTVPTYICCETIGCARKKKKKKSNNFRMRGLMLLIWWWSWLASHVCCEKYYTSGQIKIFNK